MSSRLGRGGAGGGVVHPSGSVASVELPALQDVGKMLVAGSGDVMALLCLGGEGGWLLGCVGGSALCCTESL